MKRLTPKVLNYILQAVILIGLIWAGVKYLSGEIILETLANFNPYLLVGMLFLSLLHFYIKGLRFVVLANPHTNIPSYRILRAFFSGQPATLLPGGVLARAGLMSQIGIPVATSLAVILIFGLMDQVVLLSGSLIASFWVPEARNAAVTIGIVLVVLAVILIPQKSRHFTLGLLKRLLHRFGWEKHIDHFGTAFTKTATTKTLLHAMALTLVYFALKIFILDLALLGLGIHVGIASLILGYILPHLLGRTSIIPAGVGITEATMLGLLVTASGGSPDIITAGIVIFRIAVDLIPAVFGAIVYFFFWKPYHTETKPKK